MVILDRSYAELAKRILGALISPEVMLLDAKETLDELPSKLEGIERQLEEDCRAALEWLNQDADGLR